MSYVLLTSLDAPIEQVMYLDSQLTEHTLLQAIARVNRTAEAKSYGLAVDYWGVSQSLQEALAIFSPRDIKGALEPRQDELPRLQARHTAAMRFFNSVRHRNDLEHCVAVLAPEDIRAEFQMAFRRFSQSGDMLLPDPPSSTGRRRPMFSARCAGKSSAGSRPTFTTGTNRSVWPQR